MYLDDTNLARLTSGSLNSSTGIATFTRDDASTFTIDMSAFLDAITLNNTLTSTSTTEGLTAAQGKVLKDLIDALPTSDTVDMGSGFKIANSAGTDQFTVIEDEEIRFEGSGATSVTFDASTQKVTISSTDTDTVYDDTTIQAEVDLNTAKVSNVSTNLSVSTGTTDVTVISSDGNNGIIPASTTSTAGVFLPTEKTKLNSIQAGAQLNVPANITISEGTSTVEVQSSSGSNDSIAAATSSLAGVFLPAEKTKLDGIETGAEVNDITEVAGGTYMTASNSVGPTVTLNHDSTTRTDPNPVGSAPAYSFVAVETIDTNATGHITAVNRKTFNVPVPLSINWNLSGDSGTNQNITNFNTVNLAGGTGISTVASATDTLTINLDDTAVTAGAYTAADITIDAQGRITAAANGSGVKFVDGTNTNDAVYTTGKVGIGTTNPAFKFDLLNDYDMPSSGAYLTMHLLTNITATGNSTAVFGGFRPNVEINDNFNYGTIVGVNPRVAHNGTGTVTGTWGVNLITANTSTGTITTAYGANMTAENEDGGGVIGVAVGGNFNVKNSSSGGITSAYAGSFEGNNNKAGATITDLIAGKFNITANAGIITNAYGIRIDLTSNAGSMTNMYGLYIADVTTGTQTNQAYGIYQEDTSARNYFGGNVGIGTASPTQKLHVNGNARATGVLYGDTGIYSDGYITADGNITTYNDLQVDGSAEIGGSTGLGTSSPTQKLHVNGNARVTGAYYDSNNSPGTSGQVLSSTATGTDWIDAASGSGVISFAVSDETTDIATGTGNLTMRMPHGMTLTEVRASVTTAPVGSTIIIDVNQNGSSIFTTDLLSIDAGEKTSTSAAISANITTSALTDDAEITIDIDQVGSTTAGSGLKIYLIGTKS